MCSKKNKNIDFPLDVGVKSLMLCTTKVAKWEIKHETKQRND
jgi:hypothetical protein